MSSNSSVPMINKMNDGEVVGFLYRTDVSFPPAILKRIFEIEEVFWNKNKTRNEEFARFHFSMELLLKGKVYREQIIPYN